MKVKEFMIRDVVTAHPNDRVRDVMKVLVDRKIGGLPICSEDGKLIGMVSDGDILRAIKPIEDRFYHYLLYMAFDEGQDMGTRLGNLSNIEIINIAKTKEIICVTEDEEMEKAVALLAEHHFKKLPVIDRNKHIVGVISRGDVMRKIQTSIINAS